MHLYKMIASKLKILQPNPHIEDLKCPILILILIHLLTAVGLTPGGSSTVHICTQTVRRTTQLTVLVGGLCGIPTQSGQTKVNVELTA